ncbi:hypothetical protein [Pseudoxanthomonas sp.]|uniref:hypothetical protein n=1 Tax=Pseudoxanthomonas sp. TaxID=1871049 RepID=UPI002618B06A|nr:hypothetical protein [Pseudoxanthomonas sp.]WDS34760.1 MAG: hypothetical protein O8I58_10175 [Pseudoxanthomonas sp.]
MQALITQALSRSARDFQEIVWPQISTTPIVNGGVIRPVETIANTDFKDELDLLAGIDAWQIQYAPTALRGIASRVQWGPCHESFTIRTRLPSGNETEFHKRLRAIESIEIGHLYPHLTIQAYLDQHQGQLIAAAAVRTKDLIEAAAILVENREKLRRRPDLYGFISNADGTEFLYMRWAYLQYKQVLAENDVLFSAA